MPSRLCHHERRTGAGWVLILLYVLSSQMSGTAAITLVLSHRPRHTIRRTLGYALRYPYHRGSARMFCGSPGPRAGGHRRSQYVVTARGAGFVIRRAIVHRIGVRFRAA